MSVFDGHRYIDQTRPGMKKAVTFATIFLSSLVIVLLLSSERFTRNNSNTRPISDTESAGGRGYVVTLTYSGQQGAGIRAIVSQQCWIGSVVNERYNLQVYAVEPFLRSTSFVSGIKAVGRRTALPFGEFFDIKKFNQASARLGLGQMVTIEDFFKGAPRKVTELRFTGEGTTNVVWTAQNESDCYKDSLSSLAKKGFCIIQVIQTATMTKRTKNRDTEYIFEDHSDHVLFQNWDPLQSVLVINHWSGGWFAPVDTVPTNTPVSEHPSDSSRCKYSDLEHVREHLLPSPSLLNTSMVYKKMFLKVTGSQVKIVAVMFRLEHLTTGGAVCHGKHADSFNTCVNQCLLEAVEITKSLQKQDGFSSRPFLTHDIGLYGSTSLQTSLDKNVIFEEGLKKTMQQLYGNGWTLADLDKSYSEISENEGYIAALQRHIASDADCLVLVGGGNFQDLTLHDYIRKHPNVKGRCVHFVCVRNEDIMQSAMRSGD